jgi:hypothetical protein
MGFSDFFNELDSDFREKSERECKSDSGMGSKFLKLFSPKGIGIAMVFIGVLLLCFNSSFGTKITSAEQFKDGDTFVLKTEVEQSDIQVSKETFNSVESITAAEYYISTYSLSGQKYALFSNKLPLGKFEGQMLVIKRSEFPLIDMALAEYEAASAGETLGEYVSIVKPSGMYTNGVILVIFGGILFLISYLPFFRAKQ